MDKCSGQNVGLQLGCNECHLAAILTESPQHVLVPWNVLTLQPLPSWFL